MKGHHQPMLHQILLIFISIIEVCLTGVIKGWLSTCSWGFCSMKYREQRPRRWYRMFVSCLNGGQIWWEIVMKDSSYLLTHKGCFFKRFCALKNLSSDHPNHFLFITLILVINFTGKQNNKMSKNILSSTYSKNKGHRTATAVLQYR